MPWDDQPNAQLAPLAPYNASAGPKLGLLDSLEASWEAQKRAGSIDGLAWYFAKADEEQGERARKAGVDYTPLSMQAQGPNVEPTLHVEDGTPQLKPYYNRMSAYKTVAQQMVDGEETPYGDMIRQHNQHINKLNADNPGLNLSSLNELYDGVRKAAQDAEQRDNLSHYWTGSVGGFVGGSVAGLDPRTDPLNFLTLPVGGAGKSVVGRIATQGVGQGAIEAVNQATGVQENRRLLGLEHGTENALWNIAGAAFGGAAVQGVGEAVTAGARRIARSRWFADTPHDPAPPPPPEPPPGTPPVAAPTAPTPEFDAAWAKARPVPVEAPLARSAYGQPRIMADLDHVTTALQSWGGPRAWEVAPPTMTALPTTEPRNFDYKIDVDRGTESLDSVARRVDPELFGAYDKLAAAKNDARTRVSETEFQTSLDASKATADLNAEIRILETKQETATPRLAKKYAARIQDLTAQVAAKYEEIKSASPHTANARQDLMHVDEQMRDMAPAVSRAYGLAQKKWDAYQGQREQIDEMIREGRPGIGGVKPPEPTLSAEMPDVIGGPRTGKAAVPELNEPGSVKPGEGLSEAVMRNNTELAPKVEEAQDAAVRDTIRASKDEKETTLTMNVAGRDVTLHMDEDKITIPTDDGGTRVVTVRQLIKEMEDDRNMLSAVTSCSLPATS